MADKFESWPNSLKYLKYLVYSGPLWWSVQNDEVNFVVLVIKEVLKYFPCHVNIFQGFGDKESSLLLLPFQEAFQYPAKSFDTIGAAIACLLHQFSYTRDFRLSWIPLELSPMK